MTLAGLSFRMLTKKYVRLKNKSISHTFDSATLETTEKTVIIMMMIIFGMSETCSILYTVEVSYKIS